MYGTDWWVHRRKKHPCPISNKIPPVTCYISWVRHKTHRAEAYIYKFIALGLGGSSLVKEIPTSYPIQSQLIPADISRKSKVIRIFTGKLYRNCMFRREKHRSKGNIKTNIKETVCEQRWWKWTYNSVTNSMERSPSSGTNSHTVEKFLTFYGTQRFIIVFTRVRHWYLSWARWLQSTHSHPISLWSILILSSRLHLGLPIGLFPSGFRIKIVYVFLMYLHAYYVPLPSHPWFDHPNSIWWKVQIMKLLIT